ncbi:MULTISPECIES: dihydrodipicolinate synthase family protein [unclassified Haladaptatus]|uniref:dihydrodipicolinate synthase family protein n=1 Tax=unclassified Haladaptatus TaxID=2622732 RepID=UPI00209BCA9D|nr:MULTISPECIES: dihydrodipicolinate synthase family protein [unclassified Haladaptatus]MCO8244859.1 dihydrodipicolinate synthase family protein [Haladaptatus sp. AB643]MCO8255627.1 dihydrodipicolinate synthase family protein [Haladaptatus sp. AB618]
MSSSSSPEAFEGVLCPLVTPYTDGNVDETVLSGLVERLGKAGMDGLVPAGTTGEFASLSDEEYETVLQTTVDAADDVPVLAGTADTTVPNTLERIEMAADAGADAALIVLPYFHGANDPVGNERFLSAVADDASLPLFLYNIPSCTGQEITPATVETVARHSNVHGLKDSSGDFNYFLEVADRTPEDFRLFQGFDSYVVPGMLMGASGGINALSNAIPETFVAARDAVAAGEVERARRIGAELISPLFQQCVNHGFAPATKAALESRGWLETAEVRPPLVELDAAVKEEITAGVERVLGAD